MEARPPGMSGIVIGAQVKGTRAEAGRVASREPATMMLTKR